MAFSLCQINAGARRKFLACRPRMVLIIILAVPTLCHRTVLLILGSTVHAFRKNGIIFTTQLILPCPALSLTVLTHIPGYTIAL